MTQSSFFESTFRSWQYQVSACLGIILVVLPSLIFCQSSDPKTLEWESKDLFAQNREKFQADLATLEEAVLELNEIGGRESQLAKEKKNAKELAQEQKNLVSRAKKVKDRIAEMEKISSPMIQEGVLEMEAALKHLEDSETFQARPRLATAAQKIQQAHKELAIVLDAYKGVHHQPGQFFIHVKFKAHLPPPPGKDKDFTYKIVIEEDGQRVRELDISRPKRPEVKVKPKVKVTVEKKVEPIFTVLVLDQSASMLSRTDEQNPTPKIEALKKAAARFVDKMASPGRATLLPFGSMVETPGDFSDDKNNLKDRIGKLKPAGETAFLDAVYAGIATLEAAYPPDSPRAPVRKRVIVAMTDGIDNSSRRRVQEVIDRAEKTGIPLFMVGFGPQNEIDVATMETMAENTGGKYIPAQNEKDLLASFEKLSIQIYEILQKEFEPEEIPVILEEDTFAEIFPSRRQAMDGTTRKITLKLIQIKTPGGSEEILAQQSGDYQVPGLVIAEMNPLVFLAFLGILGFLIALPPMLRKVKGA